MKILLKILCAPMIAVLSVFVWLASKLVQVSAVVMNFIAIAVGLGALCILFDAKTAAETVHNALYSRKTNALIQCIEGAKKAAETQTGGFTCEEGCCGEKDNK